MKAPRKRKPTTDAVEILHRRYFEGKPERLAALEEERANAEIARKIYELRTKAELTQQQLARIVGTSTSVICRLEDADYEGHSLSMLRRIATALNKDVEIRFVPIKAKGELLEHAESGVLVQPGGPQKASWHAKPESIVDNEMVKTLIRCDREDGRKQTIVGRVVIHL